MRNVFKKLAGTAAGVTAMVGVAATNAMATPIMDFSTFTFDTTHVENLTVAVVTGLGVIWAIRKIIQLTNRS